MITLEKLASELSLENLELIVAGSRCKKKKNNNGSHSNSVSSVSSASSMSSVSTVEPIVEEISIN